MIEFLQFTFTDFWHFWGVVILLYITLFGLAAIIAAIRGK